MHVKGKFCRGCCDLNFELVVGAQVQVEGDRSQMVSLPPSPTLFSLERMEKRNGVAKIEFAWEIV